MNNAIYEKTIPALKFVPDWFVTSKMIKKLLTALYPDDNILRFNKDSGNAVFSCNEMCNFSIDLNNINLDKSHYFEDDPGLVYEI